MNADNDDHGLTTAMRDRLDDVRPDLDRLVSVATRQGTRLRRRTRLAVSLGTVAGVAAVAVAVAAGNSWTGSGPSGAPGQPGFADEPSSSSSAAAPSTAAVTTAPAASPSHEAPPPEQSPVHLELAAWSCTPPADEKFICSSGDHSVVVNWRPASERQFWGNNPDKSADFISDVHGRFFVTVVVGRGTPSSDAVAVGQALVWSGENQGAS